MKSHFTAAIVIAALLSVPTIGATAAWVNKQVGQMQSSLAGSDCFFFTLDGVAEADPVVPGAAWFAIPRGQEGSRDAYAMLLAAKITDMTVRVHTNGTISCGYATASEVFMWE